MATLTQTPGIMTNEKASTLFQRGHLHASLSCANGGAVNAAKHPVLHPKEEEAAAVAQNQCKFNKKSAPKAQKSVIQLRRNYMQNKFHHPLRAPPAASGYTPRRVTRVHTTSHSVGRLRDAYTTTNAIATPPLIESSFISMFFQRESMASCGGN